MEDILPQLIACRDERAQASRRLNTRIAAAVVDHAIPVTAVAQTLQISPEAVRQRLRSGGAIFQGRRWRRSGGASGPASPGSPAAAKSL